MKSDHRQQGFTLLEMLIAISLLSLLAGLAYSTLRIGVQGWESADRKIDQGDSLQVGWPYLHQLLESARPVVAQQSGKAPFRGTASRISWIAHLPSHLAEGGEHWLDLYTTLDETSGEPQLLLAYHIGDDANQEPDFNRQAVLVDRLEHLQLSYFGPTASGQTADWQSDWQQRNDLPLLIRIDIRPTDAAAWPTIYARPRFTDTGDRLNASSSPVLGNREPN